MKNNTHSQIVISMKHIDNAIRFTKRLKEFCGLASTGGDAELYIKHNGNLKECGFVAHDLSIRSVEHNIDPVVAREEVVLFTHAMEIELKKHDEQRGKTGWLDWLTSNFLYQDQPSDRGNP